MNYFSSEIILHIIIGRIIFIIIINIVTTSILQYFIGSHFESLDNFNKINMADAPSGLSHLLMTSLPD